MKYSARSRQQGVVLVASLFLLLVVTTLSISVFSDVSLQEKMAGNFRAQTRVFETANSALQEQWPGLMLVQGGEAVTDVRIRDMNNEFDLDFDNDGITDLDMDASVSICFNGTQLAPGTDEDYRAYTFVVSGTSTDVTGAAAAVRQSGYLIAEDAGVLLATTCVGP